MNMKEVLFNRNFFLFRSDNSIYEKSCNKNVFNNQFKNLASGIFSNNNQLKRL